MSQELIVLNSSINVIYSERCQPRVCRRGVPSLVFLYSITIRNDFTESEKFIKKITKSVLDNGLPSGISLNVNIPKSVKGKK